MKKKLVLRSFLALLTGLLVVLLLRPHFFSSPRPNFKRFSFECLRAEQKLFFDDAVFSWRSEKKTNPGLSRNITRGTAMLISGQGQFRLKPDVRGEKGFLLALQVHSWDAHEISVSAGVKRGGTSREFAEFKSKNGYQLISRTLSLRPSDEIVITARGNGAVISGEPVIYDIVARPERRYIFLIAPDTFRGDKIGTKRGGRSLTPHIDRFKSDAVTFANSFAQSSWTLPSFMSLFTGQYEFNHRVARHGPVAGDRPFLGKLLSPGFVTVGMHGGGWMRALPGFSRGMDYFAQHSSTRQQDGGLKMFTAAADFLERNPVPSLFMFLHTYQTHFPYHPPGQFLKLLNGKPRHSNLGTFVKEKQFLQNVPPELGQDMEELYDAEILAFDNYFGRFIRYLKSAGIYKQSLIVFLSDHGEEFYEHKGWGHGHSMYNEMIRVPLLIKFPGNRSSGKVIRKNAAVIDVLPTLLDCFAMDLPAGLDGASLLPLLEKESGPEKVFRRHLLSSVSDCQLHETLQAKFAIMFDRYKLIYNYPYSPSTLDFYSKFGLPPVTGGMELYDLKGDPEETVNLYPGKIALPVSVKAEINAMIRRFHENKRPSQKTDAEFDSEMWDQLKTLGYL